MSNTVLPGDKIALIEECEAGKNSYDDDGLIRSMIVGKSEMNIKERLIDVENQKEALRLSNEDLELSSQFKSDFLATMSHEIRTPMNGVIGMLDLLLQTEMSAEQFRKSNIAKNSALSLLSIINDILDFSKIDAGKLELDIVDFDPRMLFCEFTERMLARANEKGLKLVLDVIGINITQVKGDPNRILQILNNLVSNAIKFTEEGEVTIQAALSTGADGQLIMTGSVQDTGIGISGDKEQYLFEAFHQLDASTTRKYGGTGLGLTIVRQLCELMGGDVRYTRPSTGGSCFGFKLMLKASPQAKEISPKFNLATTKVLVVDSQTSSRNILSQQLQHWGAVITRAASGCEALDILRREAGTGETFFKLIYVDEQLSDMNAIQFSSELDAVVPQCETKLLALVDLTKIESDQDYCEHGFSARIPKPASYSDLMDSFLLTTQHASVPSTGSSVNSVVNNKSIEFPDNIRVLLVEDNKINQLVANDILQNNGLSSDTVEDGVQALTALKQAPTKDTYSIILMDCQMPEMDGYECTKAIRALSESDPYRTIPIVAMTANAMQGDREKCLDAGMDDYMTKPINAEELSTKLQTWLLSEKK